SDDRFPGRRVCETTSLFLPRSLMPMRYTACSILLVFVLPVEGFGFGVINEDGNGIALRWDAAARTVGSNERSLDGGLRYSLAGGDYESYRDMFDWSSTPSVAAFESSVQSAFSAWTAVDPVSGLGTSLSFVDDSLSTAVAAMPSLGAEIDLLAGASLGVGITGGVTSVGWQELGGDVVTMTTGDVRGRFVMSCGMVARSKTRPAIHLTKLATRSDWRTLKLPELRAHSLTTISMARRRVW
ncbi:hypothetical protein ACFL2H_03585, partial [Planctomycetota bacterium]